jgi:hypothetical protein
MIGYLSALRLCARTAPACPGERFRDKAADTISRAT